MADLAGASAPRDGGEAPGAGARPGAGRRPGAATPPWRRVRSRAPGWVGLVPFVAYTAVFLGVPTASVLLGSFQDNSGRPTLGNLSAAVHGVYLRAFLVSMRLSALAALIGAVLGLVLALAMVSSPRVRLLRHVVTSASGVFANVGGVPLAFMFIATLGNLGLVTRALGALGVNLYGTGFSLFSLVGLVVVYVYFEIPLMVLVILPAVDGLRPQWSEAAASLGAARWQYWRHVGGPLLLPPFLGALLLLFTNAFAAYATAYALTTGTIPLVPLQIGSLLSGNVLANQQNLGKALGLGMIVVVAVLLGGYALLQRRTARWLR